VTITFQDAVNAAALDPDQKHAVFYADGNWPNEAAVRARCPHAELFAITVRGATGHEYFCVDCETGDVSVAGAIAWVQKQVALGVDPVCVYANQNTWESLGLRNALAHYGKRIKRWVAAYPGSGANVTAGYDAHQYASGDVDRNIALDDFFTASSKPKPKPHNSGIAKAEITVDLKTGKATIHGTKGEHVEFGGATKQLHYKVELKVGKGGGKWHINKS
jgi:hypothetical protein